MPTFPPAMNLGDLPHAVPSIMFSEPREGRKTITQVIEWSRPIAKGLQAVSVNLQNNATLEFSQICGLIVDNSDCGADLDFIFPDTEVTVSIPAYSPYIVLDVATGQTQFFVNAHNPIAADLTRFTILNYAPPPVAVPITKQQQTATVSSVPVDGVSSTLIVDPTENGTVQALNVVVACPIPSVSFNDLFQLIDGNGHILWQGNAAQQNTGSGFNVALIDLSGLSIRFQNGITLEQSGGFAPGATIDVNLYYVTP